MRTRAVPERLRGVMTTPNGLTWYFMLIVNELGYEARLEVALEAV